MTSVLFSHISSKYAYIVCGGGTAAASPPPSGLATLPSVGAVP